MKVLSLSTTLLTLKIKQGLNQPKNNCRYFGVKSKTIKNQRVQLL